MTEKEILLECLDGLVEDIKKLQQEIYTLRERKRAIELLITEYDEEV